MGMSYANRTSPVRRGSWILEETLVDTTPGAAAVEALLENTEGNVARTVRARLEVHRRAKSCNACHGVIDPLGVRARELRRHRRRTVRPARASTPATPSMA